MLRDMTQGSPAKLIWAFSLPMFIGSMFQQLYNMVDAIVVGRYVGPNALAAVGTSFPIIFFMVSLVLGMTMGSGVVISQFFGAKDLVRTRRAVVTALAFQLVFAAFLGAVGVVLSRPLLLLLNTPDIILGDATAYMRIFFGGILFMFAYNAFAGILRSLGDSKTPLYFLIISSLLNVVLNIYFVVGLNLGVRGVAWATLIAQGTSSVLTFLYIYRYVPLLQFKRAELVFDWDIFRAMVRIGAPSSIQQALAAVGMMAVQALVNSFGPITMAAYTAASRMDSFAMIPIMNFGMAVSTFTGQNIGANKLDRVTQGLKATLMMVIVACLIVSLLVFTAGGHMIRLFITGDQAEIVAQGIDYMRTISLFYAVFGVIMVLNGVLRGAGDAWVPTVTTMTSLAIRVASAYILVNTALTYRGIWWSIPIGWSVAVIVPTYRYFSGVWKTKAVVRQSLLTQIEPVIAGSTD
ncbi:MAG: Multidrug export protein MepA [Firmicutes bacterium]|nr:Multidrug export protein MepA [candidate division NPL-UPA2 bacterium]